MKKFSKLSKNFETKRFFLTIFALWLVHTSSGIQILYLQETAQAYTNSYSSALLSTLTTSFTTSMQYTISSWVKITTQPSDWINILKLSQNYSTKYFSERILLVNIRTGHNYIYATGTPTINNTDWNPWENLTVVQMFPTGQWVFLAFGTDSTANMQYGFRYYPQSTTNLTAFFDTRTLPSSSFNITPSCTVFWGGDTFGTSPDQTLQYVRLYIDYVPTSQDEMINLAIMQPGGTLYYFLFTTDYVDVQNSTFPIQYYQSTTHGVDIASINSNYPVTFGPFNMIMCRPGAVLSYDTGTNIPNQINIAFDIRINSPATTIQNLFSLRDNSTNYVSLTTYYDPADSLIKVELQNPKWNLVYTSPTAINLDQWNRVVVELQLSNPDSFGSAFYSGRIFVNRNSIPSRTYFGDYPTRLLIEYTNELTVDICSTMISGSSSRNSSIDGNYDVMNFMWYKGDGSLYQNSSDPTCFLSGFLDPNQSACLICNPGYYLDGRICVSSCSANQFLDSDTNSCQSCYYSSRYYTNTGYCLPCTSTNQLISGYSCIICDNTCASCIRTSPNNCTSCYSGAYFLSSNSSCVVCNVNGYHISGFDCLQCDSSCLTCNGSYATNCLTCPSGAYLVSANSSCVPCNVNGYYISGSQCLEDTLINNLASSGGEVTGIATQVQSLASSIMPAVLGGASTSAMLLVGFLSDVNLYMFLNVPFPDNFVSFCQKISSSALPNIFAKMDVVNQGNNPNSTIGKFKFWGVSATLLDNSYASIGKELIALTIILGLNILVLILKRCPSFHRVACKIRTVFMWNVFLSYYLGDFSELQLNSMIQMRENYVSSAYADLSLAFAVVVVATYPPLFGYMIYKLNRRPSNQQNLQENQKRYKSNNSRPQNQTGEYPISTSENQPMEKWAEVPPSIQIIAEDFEGKNIFTRNYLLIMLLETFLVILIDFFLQDYGLAQAILYTIIMLMFVSLAAWQRPYKSVFQMFILLLDLSTKNVIGIIAIILGINEKSAFISSPIIETMGLILISLIIIVIVINVVISLVIMVVSFYLDCKKRRAKHKRDPSNTQHRDTNIADRRNDNSMVELNESNSPNISLDFRNGSDLQASNHIQHQSFQKDEDQSISQARPIPLISKIQAINPPGSEIAQKKTNKSNPHMKTPIRSIKKGHFDNQTVFDIKLNSSMDVNIGSDLQASKHIQHQSFQRDEDQSISQARPIRLISKIQATNSSGSEIPQKKTNTSNPHMKAPIRIIKKERFDKPEPFSKENLRKKDELK